VLDPGEQCDDGNTSSGDGCSSTCTLRQDGTFCDFTGGRAFHLAPGQHVFLLGDTSTGTPRDAATCGGNAAPDLTYHVIADANGTLHASLSSFTFMGFLYVTAVCPNAAGQELFCSTTPTLDFAVTAGQSLFLVVDGHAASSGAFTLELSLQ
jgi:cysteine-rich repeat protein